jgi:putative transposase
MAKSTFYYHRSRLDRQDKWSYAKRRISCVFEDSKKTYGYRRITMALKAEGMDINHKTVERLMHEMGIKCEVRLKRYKSYKGELGIVAPNEMNRQFHPEGQYEKLVTDVTEFNLFGEKRYLSPIMDLKNGEILCYNIFKHPTLDMVTTMIDKLEALSLPIKGAMIHSDQGWHYQHILYQDKIRKLELKQSMSRKGNCLDNASMENFFGLLKSELLYLHKFNSMAEFEQSLEEYIDFYNNRRIKIRLGMSPVAYRLKTQYTSQPE